MLKIIFVDSYRLTAYGYQNFPYPLTLNVLHDRTCEDTRYLYTNVGVFKRYSEEHRTLFIDGWMPCRTLCSQAMEMGK